MQSFAEFAAENFHSEVLLIWRLVGTTRAIAEFTVEALKVEVSFEQREENGPWHVGFDVVRGDAAEGVYDAYLRRERSAIEKLGCAVEGPDRVDPYTQYTLRRTRPSG